VLVDWEIRSDLPLLNLLERPCLFFPMGCCDHAVMDCLGSCWLVVQCSLQVRGVIEVGRTGCWPVSDSLQVRECAEEGEDSWKEPCSFHRAQRLLVRPIPVTQGKGY
jgi:hypothetical protein